MVFAIGNVAVAVVGYVVVVRLLIRWAQTLPEPDEQLLTGEGDDA